MLIGICGLPSSGKKTLMKLLATEYACTILTVDIIKDYMTRIFLKGQATELTEDEFIKNNKIEDILREKYGEYWLTHSALDFFMNHWKNTYVIGFPISNIEEVQIIRKRPLCRLIGISASLMQRFKRYCNQTKPSRQWTSLVSLKDISNLKIAHSDEANILLCENAAFKENRIVLKQSPAAKATPLTLESFVEMDATYYPNIQKCMELADVVLLNTASRDELMDHLMTANITSMEHLRPSWDTYFMRLGFLAASRSNCMKRRVGAILVKDRRVICTGYNGTPRSVTNCMQGGCQRCNSNTSCGKGLDMCLCMHAEENALLEAGVERAINSVLYSTSFPCLQCTKRIIQLRVKEIIFCEGYATDDMATNLLSEAGIPIRKLDKEVIPYKWYRATS